MASELSPGDTHPRLPLFASIPFKLFLLIALALLPLIGFFARDLASDRDARIENARLLAQQLAHEGAERQKNLVAQASAILDVAIEVPAIRRAEVGACVDILTQIKARSPWAGGFGLIGLNGRPVCSDNPAFRDVNLSDREYFKEALRRDKVFVSNFLVTRTNKQPTVVLSRAVRNPSGDLSGVFVVTIDLAWLQDLVAEVSRKGQGLTLLLDRSATVLARHPDEEKLVGRNIADVPMIAALMKLTEGTTEGAGADGVVRLAAVATIPDSGEKLVVAFDKAVLLDQVNAAIRQSAWRFASLALGAAALAWFGGELLFLRWIRRLQQIAERLGQGDFAIAVDVPAGAGAFAIVGRAIKAAGTRLGERERDLRRAEATAREAEALFRGLFENATDCLSVNRAEPDGSFVLEALNPPAMAALGVGNDAIGRRVEDVLPPPAAAQVTADLRRVVETGSLQRFEDDRVLEGGRKVWEVVQIPLRDDKGRVARVFVGTRDISHLKEAEAAARKAETELRKLNDYLLIAERMAHVGYWRVDLPGLNQTWSPEVFRIYGLEPAAQPPTVEASITAYHPDDRASVQSAVDQAIAAGRDFEFQLRLVRPTGEIREVVSRGRVERGTDGVVAAIFGMFHDVTDVRRMEREAREANRLLLLAEQVAVAGHWRIELPSNHLTWSEGVFTMHGLDPASYVPDVQTAINFYHPEDRPHVTACVTDAIAQAKSFDFALRLLRADGETRDVFSQGLCEVDARGEVIAVFGTIMDVTVLRQAERALRENSALLETTLENMDQGLVLIGPQGQLNVSNRRFAELLDLDPAFLASKPDFEDVLERLTAAGEFDNADSAFQAQVRDRGAPLTLGTYERRRPNGIVLEVHTTPLADGGVVRTYADITARRMAEKAVVESEARYRLLADNASDLIILSHGDGKPSYFSPSIRTLLGYTLEEAYALDIRTQIHPEDREQAITVRMSVSSENPTASLVYRLRHKQGH